MYSRLSACTDYPVSGLSMHVRKLLIINDEGGK